ncbi:MAG: PilZ domain-containing protein [Pseudomonadota bacterium]
MGKKKDRIAQRLTAIKNASPSVTDARIPPMKRRGAPEREPREAVFRPGKIYLNRNDSLRCTVCNVSNGGAYIRLEGSFPLPPVVILKYIQSGVVKKARIAWQNEAEAGLAFQDTKTPGTEGDD